MHLADRCFPALSTEPRFVEALLIPFYEHGVPIGTVWIVSHTDDRKFDKEDERIVSELGKFASAGWQLLRSSDLLEARVRERTAELMHANAALEAELRERRAAEEQIKRLLMQMVTIQEDERRRIARDIHDQLGQQMTALRMQIEALRLRANAQPALADPIGMASQLSEELDQSIDFLTWQLRPADLDRLGFADALANLVSSWSQRFRIGVDCDAVATAGLQLALDVETNLYRVAQEALHNIHKHAGASRVKVGFGHRDGAAVLVIEDDGRGFDPAGVTRGVRNRSLGLVSMRERAALAGGELQIESTAGRGTTVRVRVPVPS